MVDDLTRASFYQRKEWTSPFMESCSRGALIPPRTRNLVVFGIALRRVCDVARGPAGAPGIQKKGRKPEPASRDVAGLRRLT